MKKLIIPAIVSLVMLGSCEKKEAIEHSEHTAQTEQNNASDHDDQHDDDDHDHVAANEQSTKTLAGLQLDNGKKWKTNAEMLPFIQEQERLLDAFDDDRDDHKVLAASLSAANEKLIKSCTMTGKSHDVLHIWLTGHMKNIDLLSKAATKTEADRITDALDDSMDTYHDYFQ